jgi:hypothetical protein
MASAGRWCGRGDRPRLSPSVWSMLPRFRVEASNLVVHADGFLELLRAVIHVFATLGEHRLGQP